MATRIVGVVLVTTYGYKRSAYHSSVLETLSASSFQCSQLLYPPKIRISIRTHANTHTHTHTHTRVDACIHICIQSTQCMSHTTGMKTSNEHTYSKIQANPSCNGGETIQNVLIEQAAQTKLLKNYKVT